MEASELPCSVPNPDVGSGNKSRRLCIDKSFFGRTLCGTLQDMSNESYSLCVGKRGDEEVKLVRNTDCTPAASL